MRRGSSFLLLCLVLPALALSQGSGNYVGRLEASWNPGTYVAAKPKEIGATQGSEMLNTEWYVGDIVLTKGEILGYPLKLDLLHNRLEINTGEAIKILEVNQLKEFSWYNLAEERSELFVSARDYKVEGVPLIGVLEVLAKGKYSLYKRYFIKIKEGNYIPTHSAGQLEDEYVLDEVFYVGMDKELYQVGSKKQFLAIFPDLENDIMQFSKENSLSYKKEDDIIKLVEYVSILEGQ